MIGAGLGPQAVIAGAGSGKSETMAARLVWLVANGMVRADRVLGLTFTRKAAAELADRVRSRLDRLYRAGLADVQADAEAEPVISTYHAYAGRLVSDHALREGLEPSMRLITPALSWQLAASIVAAYDGPMDAVAVDAADRDRGRAAADRGPGRAPAGARRGPGRRRSGWPGSRPRCRAGARPPSGGCLKRSGPGSSCCRWSSGTRRPRRRARCSTTVTRSSSPRGSPPVTPRSGRPSAAATTWCCSTSTRTPATRSWCCCAPCSAAGTR